MHYWGMHIFWWLFWALIIIGFFAMMKPIPRRRTGQTVTPHETPPEALQRRYAQGEISTEEYEERKEILERDALK